MSSFLEKIRKGFARTKSQVFNQIASAINIRKKIDDDLLEEIEEILISGDVGVAGSFRIIEEIKADVRREHLDDPQALFGLLEKHISSLFPESTFREDSLLQSPFVILVVGVNGTGKTTSIAKLAHRFQQKGKTVILGAADTFRAAAIEQLQEWAERIGVSLIRHQAGSDPAAVAFDTLTAAQARKADVVIVDTAGRLHTKTNLMEELKKIDRVIKKVIPDAPHLTLLVIDGTTGQNALPQARQFIESVGVDGIILTKLDGTAKGGAMIAIAAELKVPVLYIGVGEGIDDLQPFDPVIFAQTLIGKENEQPH